MSRRRILTLPLALKEMGETRADRSRADILAAAAACFMEHGYSATSIDGVARSLGATKGMIYHHYPSKTDLFIAVYSRGMDINFEAVEPFMHDGMPVQRLENMAHAHAVTMMAQQAFQRTVAQGVIMHQTGATTRAQRDALASLIAERDRYETLFSSAIVAAVEAEGRTVDDVSLTTKSLLAVLNGAVHWYRARGENQTAEQNMIAEKIVAFALRGIGLEPTNAKPTNGSST